jgi:hypothetical protein
MAIEQIKVPYREGYDFGMGADLLSGGPLAKAAEGTPVGVGQAGGSKVQFTVARVHTTSDLEQALGLHVDASYGCAAFGAGVSARFDFAESASVHTSSLFMTVAVTVSLEFLQLATPALTADAASLVDRPDLFAGRYGNVFVRGVARGGVFVGVLRVDTRSSSDAESISSDLHGSYGLFSGDAATKFQKALQQYSSEVYVQMYHEGGPVDLVITNPEDPLELLRNADRFLASFQSDPGAVAVPYEVTLAPMSIALGPPPLNYADIQHAQDVLVFCAHRRSALLDELNLMQFIADNASRYDFPAGVSPGQIQAVVAGFQSDLDVIAQCASSAINSPATAAMPAAFAAAQGTSFPQGMMPAVMPVPKADRPPPTAVVIPNWDSERAVLEGGVVPATGVVIPSAADLGLTVQYVYSMNGTGSIGDVIGVKPSVGSTVMSDVPVEVTIQRNPGPHDE